MTLEELQKENEKLKQEVEELKQIIENLRNVAAVNNLKTFGN
jgi:cell division septum initiation protein DivIVA